MQQRGRTTAGIATTKNYTNNDNGSTIGRKNGASLADLLEARPTGLTEGEAWAILCQAVQALQDLFLSDGASGGSCIPLVAPSTLLLSGRGRVKLHHPGAGGGGAPYASVTAAAHLACYLAPEYRPNRQCSDTENEKMWIYGLGETLKRATLTSHAATSRLSAELCQVFADMTEPQASARASLMHLLEVIAEYCKRRQRAKPFSHIVMDLHQEAMAQLETAALQNPWGLRAMSQIRTNVVGTSRFDSSVLDGGLKLRSWTSGSGAPIPGGLYQRSCARTREASTSMEDLSACQSDLAGAFFTPGSVARPKSICLPPPPSLPFGDVPSSGVEERHRGLANKRRRAARERRNPLSRAASRLYKATDGAAGRADSKDGRCVGPEFVVRAALPPQELVLGEIKGTAKKGSVTVIMLDGQKLNVACNPNSTTAGQLFELIVQKQLIEENFMLGLSALIAGDFVFLPSDARICKAANGGRQSSSSDSATTALTLFVRIRFFLPSLKGVSSPRVLHLLYLQLRRSVLEYQLPCNYNQLVEFGGLALQAEFGDYRDREHGTREYFLLEHYVPESITSNLEQSQKLRQALIGAHILQRGTTSEKSEETFILLAQSLPHYGGHFYTATWVLKDSNRKNVWLCISARGINIYERDPVAHQWNLFLLEMFEWKTIQTLCYSKHYLCIIPHSSVKMHRLKLKKYKLKMDHKKSYFAFRLASLHHQFFLRLRTQFDDAVGGLSRQFGIQLKDAKNEANSLYKLEVVSNYRRRDSTDLLGTVNAETEFKIQFGLMDSPSSKYGDNDSNKLRYGTRSKSVSDFGMLECYDKNVQEQRQNKENENPRLQKSRHYDDGLILNSHYLSGLSSGNNSSAGLWDKRRGVKMGTRAFGNTNRVSRSMEAVNELINDDLERLSLQSTSLHCSSTSVSRSPNLVEYCEPQDAYILDSTIKSCSNQFLPDFQETLSETFLEKLDKFSFAEERTLHVVCIKRDNNNSLGLQVMEGSDGRVYIQSVIPGGPAHVHGNISVGDQIVAVNGRNLLSLKYLDALELLKSSGKTVEFVISHVNLSTRSVGGESKLKPSSMCQVNLSNIGENDDDDEEVEYYTADSPVEKHVLESCHDNTNPYKRSECSNAVPYHKHIRYDLDQANVQGGLDREISRSCVHINSRSDKAVIVDMIPKVPSVNNVLYGGYASQDDSQMGLLPHIPLPRSLGLSRKWRGPVRYPVTPVRKTQTPCDDSCTYVATSDEEQVFI